MTSNGNIARAGAPKKCKALLLYVTAETFLEIIRNPINSLRTTLSALVQIMFSKKNKHFLNAKSLPVDDLATQHSRNTTKLKN
ncbi:hypothetical protein AWS33_07295 [Enterobacter cloacae subsp. cloacae]|nr:hypothetical protein AWS33_07295 [Enterobacter cloacae subsp. cloacae]